VDSTQLKPVTSKQSSGCGSSAPAIFFATTQLDGRACGGAAAYAGSRTRRWSSCAARTGFPLYDVCAAARAVQGGCGGSDAGVLCAVAGKEFLLAGWTRTGASSASCLLAALKHFLANEWDKARAQKRGGGETPLSLELADGGHKFQVAATNEPSPDRAFDREWALALLSRVIERLQAESEAEGKGRLFAQFESFLMAGQGESAQAEVAKVLGMRKARCAWRSTGCGSVTGNCCGMRFRTRYRIRRWWMRRCGRCSGRLVCEGELTSRKGREGRYLRTATRRKGREEWSGEMDVVAGPDEVS